MSTAQDAIEKRRIYMTTTPINQLIPRLAVPSMISMLVTNFYNMVDTFFVGQISTQATAAVGVVLPLMSIMQAFGFFCGHGSGNFISMRLGSRKIDEAKTQAANGFFLAFGLGILLAVFGLTRVTWLATRLGATPTIVDDTISYMAVILIVAPFTTSQSVINNQLRFEGSATYAMVGLVTGAVINIALDPILMFGFGMGVRGAAVATVASQIISWTILLIGTSRGPNIRIDIRNVKFNYYYLSHIFKGGFPSLARQGLNSVSVIIMNHIAGTIGGDAAIAAMSIVGRFMMLCLSALIGFGHGLQPVCTFNYGAGKYSRLREARKFCIKYGTVFMACISLVMFLFAPHIIAFFRDDPDVIAIGTKALRFLSISFPFAAYSMMNSMICQALYRSFRATILSTARSGLFYIPALYFLTKYLGLTGLEMSQMTAGLCTFLITIPIMITVMREIPTEDRLEQ